MAFVIGMCIGDLTSNIKIFSRQPIENIIEEKEEETKEIEQKKDFGISFEMKKLLDIIKKYPIHINIRCAEETIEEITVINHNNNNQEELIGDIEEKIKEQIEEIKEEIEEEIWLPYLSTSYYGQNEHGNKGVVLDGRNAVAMWQSDAEYSTYKSMHPMFREFYATHNGEDYGALPYGTKIEIRIWNQETKAYVYLGIYEVLDDSPTTQYNLSEVAKNLQGKDGALNFKYNWSDIDYRGNKTNGGIKKGYIPNWKEEYSNKICGWIDVRKAYWGMVIIEIRVIE